MTAAGPLLDTSHLRRAREPRARRRRRAALLALPWFTLGVIARIHRQAAKLWLRRVRSSPSPRPPPRSLTR